MSKPIVTQSRLKELFDYCPITGIFTRREPYKIKRYGSVAGTHKPNSYSHITVDGYQYRAHRLAWIYSYGSQPVKFLDHINQDKTDNRLCNLREVTKSQNAKNTKLPSTNTSGVIGVFFDKSRNKWVANITHNGREIRKRFVEFSDAVTYRKSMEKQYGFHVNHGITRPL